MINTQQSLQIVKPYTSMPTTVAQGSHIFLNLFWFIRSECIHSAYKDRSHTCSRSDFLLHFGPLSALRLHRQRHIEFLQKDPVFTRQPPRHIEMKLVPQHIHSNVTLIGKSHVSGTPVLLQLYDLRSNAAPSEQLQP